MIEIESTFKEDKLKELKIENEVIINVNSLLRTVTTKAIFNFL